MLRAHEPAREICPDADGRAVERAKGVADLLRVVGVSQVAGEPETKSYKDVTFLGRFDIGNSVYIGSHAELHPQLQKPPLSYDTCRPLIREGKDGHWVMGSVFSGGPELAEAARQ